MTIGDLHKFIEAQKVLDKIPVTSVATFQEYVAKLDIPSAHRIITALKEVHRFGVEVADQNAKVKFS